MCCQVTCLFLLGHTNTAVYQQERIYPGHGYILYAVLPAYKTAWNSVMCQIFRFFGCDCEAGKIVIIIHKTNCQCLDFIHKAFEQSLDNNIHHISVFQHEIEKHTSDYSLFQSCLISKELESIWFGKMLKILAESLFAICCYGRSKILIL